MDNGNKWDALPSSLRTYKNTNGDLQADMLFSVTTKTAGKTETMRHRFAVNGCAEGSGLVFTVDSQSQPLASRPMEWVSDGKAVVDEVARVVCQAAARKWARENRKPAAPATDFDFEGKPL